MGQLPVAALRDLLGIARAMYAARRRDHAIKPELDELEAIGKKLRMALELAKTNPESLGHKAGWSHAEEATARLMRLIGRQTPLAPVAEAAVIRIREHRHSPIVSRSEQRKVGHRTRG